MSIFVVDSYTDISPDLLSPVVSVKISPTSSLHFAPTNNSTSTLNSVKIVRPVIYSVPIVPTVPTVSSLLYNSSLYPSVVTYQDINNDKHLKKEVAKYFYKKIAESWLKYHFYNFYKYFTVSFGSVTLVKSLNDISTQKDSETDFESKYNHILNNYFTHDNIKILLEKYNKHTGTDLWEVKNDQSKFRHFIENRMEKLFKKIITSR